MKIKVLCLCALGLVAPIAQASIQLENVSCSGGLSISDQNGISFGCAGDLSISRGSVSVANGDLQISANGSLSLSDILLSALSIKLYANNLFIGDNVSFNIDGQLVSGAGGNGSASGAGIGMPAVDMSISDIALKSGGDITASKGGKLALVSGKGVAILSPRVQIPAGEVKMQSGGALTIQSMPLSVPLPAAFLNWLGGFAICFAASSRRRICASCRIVSNFRVFRG